MPTDGTSILPPNDISNTPIAIQKATPIAVRIPPVIANMLNLGLTSSYSNLADTVEISVLVSP